MNFSSKHFMITFEMRSYRFNSSDPGLLAVPGLGWTRAYCGEELREFRPRVAGPGGGGGGSVRPRVGNRSMRKLIKSRNRFKYDNCSTFLETRGWSLNTITDRAASEISKYDGLVRMDSPLIYTMHQITHPRLKFGYL